HGQKKASPTRPEKRFSVPQAGRSRSNSPLGELARADCRATGPAWAKRCTNLPYPRPAEAEAVLHRSARRPVGSASGGALTRTVKVTTTTSVALQRWHHRPDGARMNPSTSPPQPLSRNPFVII